MLNVSTPTIERQQQQLGSVFPFMFCCQTSGASIDDAVRWVASKHDELLQRATSHGAVLFRGYPVRSAEDFDSFISALSIAIFPYQKSLSNAVRIMEEYGLSGFLTLGTGAHNGCFGA